MKILAIFIDMLRSEQVYTDTEGWKNNEIKELLESLGGTLFSSCYTPAPDSYRSFGCFWSSLYPKKNGTMYRYVKPYDYIIDQKNVFLKILKDNNYQFNAFVGAWNNEHIGLFPNVYDSDNDNLSTGLFLSEYLQTIHLDANSFTFFNLEDLHWFLDDGHATRKSLKKGVHKIIDLINEIFKTLDIDEFDDIIFFSDHGFRYYFEKKGNLLDPRRSNIFMFWHKKGQNCVNIDNKLRTIMDIYPSILECCEIECNEKAIQGKSLFKTTGHECVLLEEHSGYYSGYLEPICQWAIIDNKKKMYYIDNSLQWYDIKGERINLPVREWEYYLEDNMTNYKELKEMIHNNSKYGKLEIDRKMDDYLSDGTLRKKGSITIFGRIIRKLYCLIYEAVKIRV